MWWSRVFWWLWFWPRGPCDWYAGGTMCANCKGGFGPPTVEAAQVLHFRAYLALTLTTQAVWRRHRKESACGHACGPGCCFECTPPKLKFKPLEPKPSGYCPAQSHCPCRNRSRLRSGESGLDVSVKYCSIGFMQEEIQSRDLTWPKWLVSWTSLGFRSLVRIVAMLCSWTHDLTLTYITLLYPLNWSSS